MVCTISLSRNPTNPLTMMWFPVLKSLHCIINTIQLILDNEYLNDIGHWNWQLLTVFFSNCMKLHWYWDYMSILDQTLIFSFSFIRGYVYSNKTFHCFLLAYHITQKGAGDSTPPPFYAHILHVRVSHQYTLYIHR